MSIFLRQGRAVPHWLTRAPTSGRPVPGCTLLPHCVPSRWENHTIDPQAVRIWGTSSGVLSSTEQGNPYLQNPQNTRFLQTLVCKQSKGHPNICHPTNHVIRFKSSLSAGPYAFVRHEVPPLSPSPMEKHSTGREGSVPRAALRRGTHREGDLSLRYWPGAALLISFRLRRLFAAKTSLPKDNFIILIIRCPGMKKCLLPASV